MLLYIHNVYIMVIYSIYSSEWNILHILYFRLKQIYIIYWCSEYYSVQGFCSGRRNCSSLCWFSVFCGASQRGNGGTGDVQVICRGRFHLPSFSSLTLSPCGLTRAADPCWFCLWAAVHPLGRTEQTFTRCNRDVLLLRPKSLKSFLVV